MGIQKGISQEVDGQENAKMDEKLSSLLVKCKASSDTSLFLNYMNLSEMPKALFELDLLQMLYMKQNLLVSVPLEINSLRSLVSLYLDSNMIEQIPETIGDLPSLQFLGLNRNRITKLPETIGNLSNLRFLQLAHNILTNLPVGIGKLKRLETLNLMNNELNELPNEIRGCINLKTLQLDGNQLTCIDQSILHLKLLQDLSVSRNRLEYLPFDIDLMDSLAELTVDASDLIKYLPGSLLYLRSLKYLGLNQCQRLHPIKYTSDVHAILEKFFEVNWVGSENNSVVPLKETCFREIGILLEQGMLLVDMLNVLPTSLIRTLHTPIGRCTNCLRSVYRAVFIMENTIYKVREQCPREDIIQLLTGVPKNASFFFIFCSHQCHRVYQQKPLVYEGRHR